jgi:hypothetical protein
MSHPTALSYICEIEDKPHRPTVSVRTHAAVQDLPHFAGLYARSYNI